MSDFIDLRRLAREYNDLVIFREKDNDKWVKKVLDQAEAQGFNVCATLGCHWLRGYHLLCVEGDEKLSIMLALEGDWIKGYPTWETDGGIKMVESEE